MTKREQERIDRLLADLGHDSVIPALEHAKRMASTLRAFHTWGACRLEMNPEQVVRMTGAALEAKR